MKACILQEFHLKLPKDRTDYVSIQPLLARASESWDELVASLESKGCTIIRGRDVLIKVPTSFLLAISEENISAGVPNDVHAFGRRFDLPLETGEVYMLTEEQVLA